MQTINDSSVSLEANKLNEKDVRHVAQLARLELTEEEVVKFQKQLSEVLDYFKIMDEVDIKNIEPTSQVTGTENRFREDDPQSFLTQDEAVSGAKSSQNKLFKVKAIL